MAPRAARGVGPWLFAAFGVAGLALGGVHAWKRSAKAEPAARVESATVQRPTAEPVAPTPEAPRPPPTVSTLEQRPQPNERPPAPVAAAPPAVFALTTPSAAPSAEKAPSPQAIQLALRQTPVVMYTATWCGVCRRARAFFDKNGIAVQERDIDRQPAAQSELKLRFGKVAVPTLVIDGDFQRPGFDESRVIQLLLSSVERRLGVRGLRAQRAPG